MKSWRQILGYRTESEFKEGDRVRVLNKSIGDDLDQFYGLTGRLSYYRLSTIAEVGSASWKIFTTDTRGCGMGFAEPIYVVRGGLFLVQDLEKVND
jgi:hypothetical protein